MVKSAARECLVQAVACLLSSNSSANHQLIGELCAWQDPALAELHLDILAAVFGRLSNIPRPPPRSKYESLLEVLGAPDLALALSVVELCGAPEQDGILDLVMHLLSERGLAVELLKAMVEQEVANTGEHMNLDKFLDQLTR